MSEPNLQGGQSDRPPPNLPDKTVALSFSSLGSQFEKSGDFIGRYRLIQTIGEGGMGTVWMAEQEEPVRRRVALKIIKLGMDTKEVIGRFEAERQALALMDHPNIAKVLDAGATSTGRPYFVMELVRGIKITDYCDQNRLSLTERLKLFITTCRAIQHAHQKGIIHRDIKPSNVLVTLHDDAPAPKVIDFGIAKATSGQRLTTKTVFTELEQFIGTPAYMSPEQAEMSSLDIDTRTDIYSLGVVLYELLTTKTPFDADELSSGVDCIRRIIREKEPLRPSLRISTMVAADKTTVAHAYRLDAPRLIQQVGGDLDWIVMKCLEKDRTRRYGMANSLALDVQRHLDFQPVEARPPSKIYLFQRFAHRNKLALAAATAILVLLLVGVILETRQAQIQKRLRLQAQESQAKAQTEAVRSKEVAQFLESMLEGIDPAVARGHDTTILRNILDQTTRRLNSLQDQPAVAAELCNTIGNVYTALGSYAEAEQMHRQALTARQKLFGNGSFDVAGSLSNLGDALRLEGKLAEANDCYRQALAIEKKLFGDNDPNVATAMSNLGRTLLAQGKLPEAEDLQRQALAVRRKLLGNDDPAVAISLSGLATVLQQQGKLTEAESLYREALAMRNRLLDARDPVIPTTLCNLANVLREERKLDEAQTLYREALNRYHELLGSEHPVIATTLHNLANVYWDRGQWVKAEATQREALAMRRKLLFKEHPDIAQSLESLATVLAAENQFAEAGADYQEALAIRQKQSGEDDPEVATTLGDFAALLSKEGKFAQAADLFRRSSQIREKVLPESWVTFNTRSRLGEALLDQKQYDASEPLLVSGWEGLNQRRSSIPPASRVFLHEATQRLVRLYTETERPEKAAEWKKRLDDSARSVDNPNP